MERKQVKLRLSGGDGQRYGSWPVTQGIPFADGEFAAEYGARVVDAAGEPRPTQCAPLATWSSDLRFVRWLLVDFQADVRPGEEQELFLEYGPGADRARRQEREESDNPVYTGPGVDLAEDTVSPGGTITNRPPVDIPCEHPRRAWEPLTSLGRLTTADHPPPAAPRT